MNAIGARKIKKLLSIMTAFFFLTAQPLYANASFLEDESLFRDEETHEGFVDASRAEEGRQRQLQEVERMNAQVQDETISQDPVSIISKFQATNDETLKSELSSIQAEKSTLSQEMDLEKANSTVDVANLKMNVLPSSNYVVEPIVLPVEDSAKDATTEEVVDENQNPQPVAQAELDPTLALIQTEQNPENDSNVQVAASDSSDSNSQTGQSLPTLSAEALLNQGNDPILLAGIATIPVPVPGQEVLTAPSEDLDLLLAQEVSFLQVAPSGVATELVAIMGLGSVGSVVGGAEAPMNMNQSLMGALPESIMAPPAFQEQPLEDPPIVLFPIPEPSIGFTPGNLLPDGVTLDVDDEDLVGGYSLFGRLLEAIREMIFADTNLGNGKEIGDGVNDKVTLLSNFMVLFFQFFGYNFKADDLRELFLRGTTQSGIDLFGISDGDDPVVPLILLFSSFILATSAFFPQTGVSGLDVNDIRSRKPGAYKFSLPIILPEGLLISLGKHTKSGLGDSEAGALGRSLIAGGIASFLGITLSLKMPTDGKPLKIFNPLDPENFGEFAFDEALDLTLPDDAIQFTFDDGSTPDGSDSVMALLRAMNGNQTGLFGILTIDFSSIINSIGAFITKAFSQNLGPILAYYKSIGMPTGVNAPPPALPLLMMLGFGFKSESGAFNNPLYFPLMLALPLIFSLSSPPIPDISNPNEENSFNKNIYNAFFANTQDNFETRQKEAKKQDQQTSTKEKKDDKKKESDKKKPKKTKKKKAPVKK